MAGADLVRRPDDDHETGLARVDARKGARRIGPRSDRRLSHRIGEIELEVPG
ncbi:hypothetical protein [Streptomyces sp. NPDC050263]|uniref:hypothetical protein n=1 Tax=Streptomyces sp. NPDC050263 TaxID=3155037 RepID=UPI003436A8D6